MVAVRQRRTIGASCPFFCHRIVSHRFPKGSVMSQILVVLPRNWPSSVKSAILHVISLAQFATAYTRGWAANSPNARIRLAAKNERLKHELALLHEQDADQGCPHGDDPAAAPATLSARRNGWPFSN